MAPSSSKPPPPPSNDDTSSTSDSDEEEEEEVESSESDKAPPAPEPEGKKRKLSPSAEAKNPHRIWSFEDQVRILEALAAHRREHGSLPKPSALLESLAARLDRKAASLKEITDKVHKLKVRYTDAAKKGVPRKGPDRRLYKLSKFVWGDKPSGSPMAEKGGAQTESKGGPRTESSGGDAQTKSKGGAQTEGSAGDAQTKNNGGVAQTGSGGGGQKGFEEMCELYPYLADEVRSLEANHPGMAKRAFEKMSDDAARALDEKIKKQRLAEMKLEIRRAGLTKEVMTTCTELLE